MDGCNSIDFTIINPRNQFYQFFSINFKFFKNCIAILKPTNLIGKMLITLCYIVLF